MENSNNACSIVVHFPCKNDIGTIEVMRRYLNIRLAEGLRIVQQGRPYHVPFSFSREEALRFTEELKRIGTESQILSTGEGTRASS